ncbi:threonyl-tRNA synthetase [Ophiocordyceps camponoti-floridani]|uniref:threonine--tRNA ligase n=1 Tax=Ophiocordyceps camponoti-floridani TaxID=2030778 RepID=A0A8H4QAY0_9HYPO|nr:threonyl-tRNA synthetase [Ophiocordyceps camponoti-floridani]
MLRPSLRCLRLPSSKLAIGLLSPSHRTRCPPVRAINDKANHESSHDKTPDHRSLGIQQELFINSVYSPGSPIFLPHGTRVFNRLVDFLRKLHIHFGFHEVITPTMYKKSLWAKSGHLQNYDDNMYTVTGNVTDVQEAAADGDEQYGLKPMNCPGHCLIFKSKVRSYRDLPIRYADFSPLHRNESSGALSGLTRVRRFHQDDGHIFCRPCQVEDEISKTLDFVKAVYGVLNLGVGYRLVLSTRPVEHYIGTEDEWARAENHLKRALEASGTDWSVDEGQGAFYGPKIDIVLKDPTGKEHQTATIQLDFQLPKRFELEYQAPAPEMEARGETATDAELLANYGPVMPVMIHRAVLGSFERLMALLIESYNGKWPFWLNPRQAIVLTIKNTSSVVDWAEQVCDTLRGTHRGPLPESLAGLTTKLTDVTVDVDATARPVGAKIRDAREKGYGMILVVGDAEVGSKQVSLGKERLSPAQLLERMRQMTDSFQ